MEKKITEQQLTKEERSFFLACVLRQKATSFEIKARGLTEKQKQHIYNLVLEG